MFIINGIAYAGEPAEDLKITSVQILDDLYMIVVFSGGEKRVFDASVLLEYPVYKALSDRAVFDTAKVVNGILTWQNGDIDIAPETVYAKSFPYEESSIKTA